MRRILAAVALLLAPLGAAQSTRCDSETIHLDGLEWQIRRLGDCASDKSGDALWHLDRLDSIDGHLDGKFQRFQSRALVYIIDTGVELDHSEFADGNLIAGLSPATTSTCPDGALHPCLDRSNVTILNFFTHGTGVASVVGGRRVGVAPGTFMVSVCPIGTYANAMYASDEMWIHALDAIVAHAWDPATPQVKTAIVTMSFQTGAPQNASEQAGHVIIETKIRNMTTGVDRNGKPDPNGKRFLFTIAAGNAGPLNNDGNRGQCTGDYEVRAFPASLGPSISGLITVGGITRDNTLWSDSCRGSKVELFAPADDIFVAVNTGVEDYRLTLSSGTSWAAPIVAGVAARMLTINPDLTPQELESMLESSPSSITDPPPGPANGRVAYLAPPIIPPHRRATAH